MQPVHLAQGSLVAYSSQLIYFDNTTYLTDYAINLQMAPVIHMIIFIASYSAKYEAPFTNTLRVNGMTVQHNYY
jgi:hypothetical protein